MAEASRIWNTSVRGSSYFVLMWTAISLSAGEMQLIEPGATYRGNKRSLSTDFPFTNIQQYYGQSERPVHYAYITKPFYISKTEVTVGEFKKFVESTSYKTEAEHSGKGIIGWSPSELAEGESGSGDRHDFTQDPKYNWKNPGFAQSDNHPVVGVSWNDAQAYCKWLTQTTGKTHRLPTEAEWEMAARGDSKRSHFYWGDDVKGSIQKYANIGNSELEKVRKLAAIRHWAFDPEKEPGDGYVFTAPVGSFAPNSNGLYDMSGNVLEWCQDYFNFTYYDHWMPKKGPNPVAVDPLNTTEKDSDFNERRTLRGGSWYLGPLSARTSARNFFDAEVGTAYIGFRVVQEASTEEAAKYPNPYKAYEANIKKLKDIGARMSPINRWAQIHPPDTPLTLEITKAITAIPGAHIFGTVRGEPWTQELIDVFTHTDALHRIGFRGKGFEEVNLTQFAKQQSELTNLDISATGLSDIHFQQLGHLRSLTEVSISCQPGAISDQGLKFLTNNPKLRALRLWDTEVTGEFVTAFQQPSLLYLNVAYSRSPEAKGGWTKEGCENLSKYLPRLVELSFTHQKFTDLEIEPLTKLSRLSNFSLTDCPNLTDEGIAKLISQMPRLDRLNLTDTPTGQTTAYVIPKLYFLRQIRIESTGLTDASIEQISRSRSLRSIHLESDDPVQYTAKALASLWRIPNLESLRIDAPIELGEEFENFTAAPAIQELTLHHASLTPHLLQNLPRIGTLERLNITRATEDQFNEWTLKVSAVRPRLKIQKR